MSHQIEGTIIHIGETEQVTDKLTKRFFVLRTEGKYPQEIKIEAINKICSILDFEQLGNTVKVFVTLNGRSWTNKDGKKDWFNSISLWKIEQIGSKTATIDESMKKENRQIPNDLPF